MRNKLLYVALSYVLLTPFSTNASPYFATICKNPPSGIKYTSLENATIETIAATTDNSPSPYFYVRERNTKPVIIAEAPLSARMSDLVKVAYLTQAKVNICLSESTPFGNSYSVQALELDLR